MFTEINFITEGEVVETAAGVIGEGERSLVVRNSEGNGQHFSSRLLER